MRCISSIGRTGLGLLSGGLFGLLAASGAVFLIGGADGQPPAAVAAAPTPSLNTTSQGRAAGPYSPVPVQPFAGDALHRLLAGNDLGAHCIDLDVRIATILPPFNVLHAQVVATGARPRLLTGAEAKLVYSSVANPGDPALAKTPVTAANGSIYKSDFGPLATSAYGVLYPAGVLASFYPTPDARRGDLGLPVPDVEQLYLKTGQLTFHQQTMPSVTASAFGAGGQPTSLVDKPYAANAPQPFRLFETDYPLFLKLAFGYTAPKVKWFAAEGIPITPFDDIGRENPYPMMRLQAQNPTTGAPLASLDVVVPVSSEMNCKSCHLPAPFGNGMATKRVSAAATPNSDPQYGKVLQWVSEEWAAKINALKLHDVMHKTSLFAGYDAASGAAAKPVLCQACHYSPALDLTQGGPKSSATGLAQTSNGSMSHVMHSGHGGLIVNGAPVFPLMPPPTDPRRTAGRAAGSPINAFTQATLESTCYQCHPGKRTQCLRGKMYSAGIICQDCHGNMNQVGDDFSRDVAAGKPFVVATDFYTNAKTPRVPWLDEPTCGSCHTGDAASNMASRAGAVPAADHIRLIQAFLSGDPKATPILPVNKRFAEPLVTSGAAKGNPQLFRLSVDSHGGVFCEGCHGSTHAEWPVANPAANDNITVAQLQGHAGKLLECDACHTGSLGATLAGPHGMHPVGNKGYSAQWVGAHPDFAEGKLAQCATCHGATGQGTVLAKAAIDRPNLECHQGSLCPGREGPTTLPAGTEVGCGLCHENPFQGGGSLRAAASTGTRSIDR